MKELSSLALVLAICVALLPGCAATPASDSREAVSSSAALQRTPSPVLENCVVERVAEFVQEAVGGDLFEIETVKTYDADYYTMAR